MTIKITTEGLDEKGIRHFLNGLDPRIGKVFQSETRRWVLAAHRASLKNLSGAGLKSSKAPGGAYPVPVRTGHLRRSEGYVLPGLSKHGLSAGAVSGLLVNTAVYASNVHEGTHRHEGFGARPFQQDAVDETRGAALERMLVGMRRAVAHA